MDDINATLQTALNDSVKEAFSMTLSMDAQTIEAELMPHVQEAIISSIGFTGKLEGNLSICVLNADACAMVSNMLGMEITEVTSDVCDGIGEIVNMVLGGVKMKISGPEMKIEIGIPTTILGNNMQVLSKKDKTFQLKYNFSAGTAKFTFILNYKIHEQAPEGPQQKSINALEKLSSLMGQNGSGQTACDAKQNALDALNKAVQQDPSKGGRP